MKIECRNLTKKIRWAVLFLVLVLLAAWVIQVNYLIRRYQEHLKIEYVQATDAFEQNGCLFTVKQFHWTTLEELKELYGEPDEDMKELYSDAFYEENTFRYLLVTFEYQNMTEEEVHYPAYDIIACTEMTRTAAWYAYVQLCNGGDSKKARTVQPGETTTYTNVYPFESGVTLQYLVFTYDGEILKLIVPEEGWEIKDGELVEA